VFHRDARLGIPSAFVAACGTAPPGGYASNFTDCDDSTAQARPGGTEYAGDEIDGNCDGTEVCFLDDDNDGYLTGQIVLSSDTDCADSGEGRFTEPAGDCCDQNADARPGQTLFFSVSNGCGGYDYNCDGIHTQQFTQVSTTTLACGGSPPFCVDLGTGWVTSVAFCGVTANYRDCSSTCGTTIFPLTQPCR